MGSIGAISAAAVFVFLADKAQNYLIPILIAYATGTLLTAALYGLIPEAIEGAGGEPHGIMLFVLGSILFFFFLEKIIIWRNCPDESCDVHAAAGPIVLVGDAFHNLTDGIVIAAAFLTDFTIGIAVGFAILAHEIPQETGDIGILLNGGFSKRKSYIYNAVSSSTTIPSAIISYFILESIIIITPYILAISAASFLYIALSDLTPELHQRLGLKHSVRQLIFIIAGILTMLFIFSFAVHSH
ncbi:MAG: ZIP family metal transporter [Promethearchaeota archaeon]|nr:MAG: ZIP family metal transporter [Candidatus Lokiarchaeota archaeon]